MFTIFETPQTGIPENQKFIPSFNRVLIRCLSDNALNPGFKYVVTLIEYDFPTGINGGTIATLKFDPLPDVTAPIEFDISRVINTEFEYLDGVKTWFSGGGNFTLGFTDKLTRGVVVNIREEWTNPSTGQTEIGDETESALKIFPGAFSFYDLPFFDVTTLNGFGVEMNPLTNQNELFIDYFGRTNFAFYDPGNKISHFNIYSENVDGTTNFEQLFPSNQGGNTKDIAIFTFSPSFIVTTAFPKKIFISVVHEVYETSVSSVEISPCLIAENTPSEKWKRLHWLNEFGVFDSMLFAANSKTSFDTKREMYQKQYAGNGFSFDSNEQGFFANTAPVFYNETKKKIQIVSNWLSDEQSKSLKNLFASSLVFIDEFDPVTSGTRKIPVKIISSNYSERYARTDKTFQVTIDVEFSEPHFRQII